jgi:putative transcriptional regulator
LAPEFAMKIAYPRIKGFVCCLLLAMLLIQAAPASPDDTPVNGVFLVANPRISDPLFRQSVVLITEPEVGGGPMGVIVNRPLDIKLSEAVPELGKVPEKFDQLYRGGPVEFDQIVFLVRTGQAPENSLHVLPEVYLSADRDLLEKIVRGETKVTALRAFAGFAGWAPGQLQAEIERGDWYFIKADPAVIFAEDMAGVWAGLIARINMVHTRGSGRDGRMVYGAR